MLYLGGEQEASSSLNSLELLQQKAQGILNNASHGLLKNSLADLSYSKSLSKDDPHFKHRCKFCGKVFGSDSALQIHIRYYIFSLCYHCIQQSNKMSEFMCGMAKHAEKLPQNLSWT